MKITHEGKVLYNGESGQQVPKQGETICVNFKDYRVLSIVKNYIQGVPPRVETTVNVEAV